MSATDNVWDVTLTTGERLDARTASLFSSLLKKISKNHPVLMVAFDEAASGKLSTDKHIIKELNLAGLVDKSGRMRPIVKTIYEASRCDNGQGGTEFISPFEPANENERIILLRVVSLKEHGEARFWKDLNGGNNKGNSFER